MKSFIWPMLYIIGVTFGMQIASAQTISADSLISISLFHINQSYLCHKTFTPLVREDFNSRFYIEDIVTRKPFAGESCGIYEFSEHGEDIPLWIMLNDSTGCKVYLADDMNSELLGQLLLFFRRNNYSSEKSLQYIEKIYKTIYAMSCVGERFLEAPILPELN